MAWFKNGRKYWKHNGRIYSCKLKRKTYSFTGYTSTKKHTEAMEYRRKLLKENRNSWYSPAIQGSSIAISGTDDEILEIKRRNEARERKENLNNTNDNIIENIWAN